MSIDTESSRTAIETAYAMESLGPPPRSRPRDGQIGTKMVRLADRGKQERDGKPGHRSCFRPIHRRSPARPRKRGFESERRDGVGRDDSDSAAAAASRDWERTGRALSGAARSPAAQARPCNPPSRASSAHLAVSRRPGPPNSPEPPPWSPTARLRLRGSLGGNGAARQHQPRVTAITSCSVV